MAKAATSGQARAFNAMIISRIDEEALSQIYGEKFQNAIDKPDSFIHNFIRFINNDCRFLKGPLIINLDDEPRLQFNAETIEEHIHCDKIVFEGGQIKLVDKLKIGEHHVLPKDYQAGEHHVSPKEYRERLKQDKTITILNANIIDFFENYQCDPLVAKFLEHYKGKELYQFGTIYRGGNGQKFITCLRWDGKVWRSHTEHFDDSWT
jgi:hypothetical protein